MFWQTHSVVPEFSEIRLLFLCEIGYEEVPSTQCLSQEAELGLGLGLILTLEAKTRLLFLCERSSAPSACRKRQVRGGSSGWDQKTQCHRVRFRWAMDYEVEHFAL